MQKILQEGLPNKDELERLVQGCFEKTEDLMVQCNLANFADGRILDYLLDIREADFDFARFFRAFVELNECAGLCVRSLVRAIDLWLSQAKNHGDMETSERSIADLMLDATTITSGTRYLAKAGSGDTFSRTNTAAFAIYWLTKNNPGMHILDAHGDEIDLSKIETDPSRILIVPGKELSLALKNKIGASMHPTRHTEGEMCFTLRTFVYLEKELMNRLSHEQTERNKILTM
jgi:hypothetical protein